MGNSSKRNLLNLYHPARVWDYRGLKSFFFEEKNNVFGSEMWDFGDTNKLVDLGRKLRLRMVRRITGNKTCKLKFWETALSSQVIIVMVRSRLRRCLQLLESNLVTTGRETPRFGNQKLGPYRQKINLIM